MKAVILFIVCTIGCMISEALGSLDCQLFGKEGCEAHCNIVCILYECVSEPSCGNNRICDCNEKYKLASGKLVTKSQYRELSEEELLYHLFEESSIPTNALHQIKEGLSLTYSKHYLNDPRKIGSQVRSDLLIKFDPFRYWPQQPAWLDSVRRLKTRKHGISKIYDYFIDSENIIPGTSRSYTFDVKGLDRHIKELAQREASRLAPKIQDAVYTNGVRELLATVTNIHDLNAIMEQSNAITSSSLRSTLNDYLQTGKHVLTELHLKVSHGDTGTEFADYSTIPEYSLDYAPYSILQIIPINVVMELFKVHRNEVGNVNGAVKFKVKMSNSVNGAKMQAWSANNLEGFVSRTAATDYRKSWTNGDEKLRIVEAVSTEKSLIWLVPSKSIEVSLVRERDTRISRYWSIKDTETFFERKPCGTTVNIWKEPSLLLKIVFNVGGGSELKWNSNTSTIILGKKASGDVFQNWAFNKNVQIQKTKTSSKRITEEVWNFTNGSALAPVFDNVVTNNRNSYETENGKYKNYMRKFCEALKYDFDACII